MTVLQWIERITPFVGVGLIAITLVVLIFVLIRTIMINRRVGEQDFEIIESIKRDEHENIFFDLTVSNKAFSTNYLNTVGFIKGNVIQILSEIDIAIAPRTKYSLTFPMEVIESLTIKDATKYKNIKLFAENELGLKHESNGKLINKFLKRSYRANKRNERKLAKEERFETGNYNFGERIWLVIKLFFRPFYKLAKRTKQSTNIALKESEIRRIYKAEHDKIEKNLVLTTAKANELMIKEESYNENRTRETMLELLKQEKILEIENLKLEAYEKAFEQKKQEVLAISPKEEFEKYILKNPINYDEIETDVLKVLLKEIKEDIEQKNIKEKAKKKKAKKTIAKALEKETSVKDDLEEQPEEVKKEPVEIVEEKPKKEEIQPVKEKKKVKKEIDLYALKVTELKSMAREQGIKYYGTMKKAELIEALKK